MTRKSDTSFFCALAMSHAQTSRVTDAESLLSSSWQPDRMYTANAATVGG